MSRSHKKIEWLLSGHEKEWIEENWRDGGYVYDTSARFALKSQHDLKVTYLFRGNDPSRFKRLIEFAGYLKKSITLQFHGEIVVRDPFSTAYAPFDPKRKNVVLLHHIDIAAAKRQTFNQLFVKRFFRRAPLADHVVAVSEYWRDIMLQKGCRNVSVIYNSFDPAQFRFTPDDSNSFAARLGIPQGKPVIYLGNARREKGFDQAYEVLKDLDAILVATGQKKMDLPVIQVYLDYADYLKLLAISSVAVTMSLFDEGWCRNAHEAMLCSTPVVGSGRGGMKELLEKGGQTICRDFGELRQVVQALLADDKLRKETGKRGYAFASQFDNRYFSKAWLDLIDSL